ncbi:hypothetical protein GOBAR_AA04538 [Gossypium barbadense]|uniref:Uncharacterized protein n=1 Tax=Gossypium barbadense TaxID=3634 RepID=A0A2P5YKF3_GOSBA|nr:hypothetical protein GOBAR_AA04538 [Gossypium barbadense]
MSPNDDMDGGVVGSSRFSALNVNHREEKGKQSRGLDGIDESRKSGAQDTGREDTIREQSLVGFPNKIKTTRKGISKNKGKAIVIANRPKTNLNILKPSNKKGTKSCSWREYDNVKREMGCKV